MSNDDEQRQLASVQKALVAEFAGRIPAEEVGQRFTALVAEFQAAPVRSFVPVLVQRRTRELLRATAT
jgi:hypothetical protein